MREIYEQVVYVLWIIVHHRWLALITAILICFAGWGFVKWLPNKYEVETKVYFDTKTVLKPLLQGLAVDNTIREDSAIVMRRTLTSRPNLLQVAQETEMDLNADTPEELEDILTGLALNMDIKAVSLRGSRRNQELYSITYVNEDPKLAKEVVESILSIFIESVLGSSRKDSDKAEKFLDEKILEYQKKLESAEERLKIFKQKNPSLSQEQDSTFFKRLHQARSRLDEAKLTLREEMNKNQALKKQMQDLRTAQSNASTAGQSSNNTLAQKSPLEQRVDEMQRKLDELQLQFTDKHPDVVSTRRILDDLKQQLENEKSASQTSGSSDSTAEAPTIDPLEQSVFYQELKLLISESDSEVAAINARIAEYQSKIDEMSKMISIIPEIEAELVRLNRDYSIVKETYDNLVQRKASAQISREAEQTGGELQFKIIEPPRIPLKPVSPDRLLLSSIVLLASLVAGAALTWLFEQMNPSFYSIKQLQEATNHQVYGSISMNWSKRELVKRKTGMFFYLIMFSGLIASYAALLMYYSADYNLGKYLEFLK